MLIFQLIILIVLLISAVIFYGDFVIRQYQKLKRFHIGRWKNEDEWYSAIKKVAVRWLKKTPTVSAIDDTGNYIIRLFSSKRKNDSIQSWQKAGLVLGISESIGYDSSIISEWKRKELTVGGCWINPVNKVDFAFLAYALLKTEKNPSAIKSAMDVVIEILEKNLCDDGMISYSKGSDSNLRYVDTLGMVCPFCALYGKIYDDPKYIEMAYEQIRLFKNIGVFSTNQLPCHVYLAKEKQPLGVYGWGRGTVWYMIALIGCYNEMPVCQMKEDIKSWIIEASRNYLKYQQEDGGFNSILQDGGHYDSSVTAGMAWFYSQCALMFDNIEYQVIADKCIKKIMSVTMKNGEIDLCQGDTHGVGIFSQKYDVMPFVQGLTLDTIRIRKFF